MTVNKPLTTPCIGLCSTVFGDSVCRGCMRFIHEVIDWNRYNDAQKQLVWQRLDEHLHIILPQFVRIYDPRKIIAIVQSLHLAHDVSNIWRCVYDVIRASDKRSISLSDCGFHLQDGLTITQINEQLFALAVAYYQKDFLRASDCSSS
jgi:predicted Fe-S protein YdhL (DUF1289 family)